MRTPNRTIIRLAAIALLGWVAAPSATAGPPSAAPRYHSVKQYEVALAKRIFETNRGHTITGKLQPLLRAVVVLHFEVDGAGKVHNVQTWRAPEREADRLARASLTRTGALPAPPPQWLRGGRLGITETWLFNNDGRFHLRALKPRQG